jgi:hypothetical protein
MVGFCEHINDPLRFILRANLLANLTLVLVGVIEVFYMCCSGYIKALLQMLPSVLPQHSGLRAGVSTFV